MDGHPIWPLYDKVTALNKIMPPATNKLLHNFLGLISFDKLFIPQASKYTSPMSDLLKKNARGLSAWNPDLLNRFAHLKSTLVSDPLLRLPNPQLPFVFRTYASNQGLCVVLLQYYDDQPNPIS